MTSRDVMGLILGELLEVTDSSKCYTFCVL